MGGVLATHVTERVKLDFGQHWELIHFIVVPKMMEEVILGLMWLDKWGPTIWWAGGCQHLRIGVGPNPPLHEQMWSSVFSKVSNLSPRVVEAKAVGEAFPAVYRDLVEVFSEKECDALPPHCPTDCAIEIQPGARLSKPKM